MAVIACQLAQAAIGALVMLYLATVLDAATFGKYVFITTTCAILPLFAGLGTEHVLIMEASRQEALLPFHLGNALAVRGLLSLVLVVVGVAAVVGWDFEDRSVWLCIWLGSIIAAFSNPLLMAVYRITRNHIRPWIYSLIGAALLFVLVLSMGQQATLTNVALAFAGAHLATLALFAFDIAKRTDIRIDPKNLRNCLKDGVVFASSQACDFIFARLDVFIVQAMCGSRALGVYSIAQKLVSMLQLVPASMNIVELPEFHRAASDPVLLTTKFRKMRRALTEVGTIAFGLLAINAAAIIGVFFSAEYESATGSLIVLCASGLLLFANYPYYMLAEAIREIRARLVARIATTIGTALAVGVGVKLMGVVGAAYGVLVGQLLFLVLLHRITRAANGGVAALLHDARMPGLGAVCLVGATYISTTFMKQSIGAIAGSVFYMGTLIGACHKLRWSLLTLRLARGKAAKPAPETTRA